MHYYQFNIGDYASHTRHLTLIEDIAYRRLIDLYYLHERPLNVGIASVSRQIGMRDNEADVKEVLVEFFLLTESGWVNKRADSEIENYKRMSDGGKRGADKRWGKLDSPPIATPSPPNNTPNAKHKPLTKNH